MRRRVHPCEMGHRSRRSLACAVLGGGEPLRSSPIRGEWVQGFGESVHEDEEVGERVYDDEEAAQDQVGCRTDGNLERTLVFM